MTHDVDSNCTLPQGTEGDGFVMIQTAREIEQARIRSKALDELAEIDGPLWNGIEDDVREIERHLR